MDPRLVRSPKAKIKSKIDVLVEENDFSIAIFKYGKSKKIGIRWNATEFSSKGFPTSRGVPTWFILPKRVAIAYVRQIGNVSAYNALIQVEEGF